MIHEPPILGDVVERLAEGFLRGVSPLERIGSKMQMMPIAGASGKSFHGINRWTLILENRRDPRWFTQQQAEHLGARLRDGESGVKLVYWKRTETKNGQAVALEKPELLVFTVFNAEQFDGISDLPEQGQKQINYEAVRDIFRNCGCKFEATDKQTAFYTAERDVIFAPQSKDAAERDKRLFDVLSVVIQRQEMTQSGHESAPKGSALHAEESLTQAIASFLTALDLGLPYNDGLDRAYYRDWAKLITDDPIAFLLRPTSRCWMASACLKTGMANSQSNNLRKAESNSLRFATAAKARS